MSFEANKQTYGFFTKKSGETNVNRYRCVVSEGVTVKSPTYAGSPVLGVCQLDDPENGQATPVQYSGVAMIEASGVIAADAEVSTGTDGRVASRTVVAATKQVAIAGGAAGPLTVTGIKTTDRLISVLRVDLDATAANIDVDDLTSEFSISAADTITNAGGSATTGDKLIVTYETGDVSIGKALIASGAEGDIIPVLLK
jgi:hypothetical protein